MIKMDHGVRLVFRVFGPNRFDGFLVFLLLFFTLHLSLLIRNTHNNLSLSRKLLLRPPLSFSLHFNIEGEVCVCSYFSYNTAYELR